MGGYARRPTRAVFRSRQLLLAFAVVLLYALLQLLASSQGVASTKAVNSSRHSIAAALNVLMILIDDLRPALGCYGDRLAKTPHIDRLANESVRFEAAYASVATCRPLPAVEDPRTVLTFACGTAGSPSRTSLLTGLRPDSHGVYDLNTHFRDTVPHATTLPQLFRQAGYLSLSYGKVFHENLDDMASWSPQTDFDDGEVWRGTSHTCAQRCLRPASLPGRPLTLGCFADGRSWWYMEYDSEEHATPWRGHKFGLGWERSNRPEVQHVDHAIASRATRAIRRLAARPAVAPPFFLAAGFIRPHLPFSAPEWAWQAHGPSLGGSGSRFRLPPPEPPEHVSEQSRRSLARWGELKAYNLVPPRPRLTRLPDDRALEAIQGYYAGVTWVDRQVGRVLQGLRAGRLWERTVVVLASDHGWKLGEHGAWSKHTNFETDVRVPLIVRLPAAAAGSPPARGVAARGVVELIDVLPSLAEIAGVGGALRSDGTSFAPQLHRDGAEARRRGKPYALSQWLAHTRGVSNAGPEDQPCMSYAIRTATHAAHVWLAANASVEEAAGCANSSDVYALAKPGALEATNLARDAEGAAVLDQLRQLLAAQQRWRPRPEEGLPQPLKRHYVVWPAPPRSSEAERPEPTRDARHVCATLECTKQRCVEVERLPGAWMG